MRSRMPQAIWALGLVSLFMDVSSEMIHGLLPIFVVGTLGASAFALGLMEGVAEAVASVLKPTSPRARCTARPSACARRSTPSAPSPGL